MPNEIGHINDASRYLPANNTQQASDVASTVDSRVALTSDSDKVSSSGNYYQELCKKFNNLKIALGNGIQNTSSVSGINNVQISPEYIKKAAADSEIAAELEKNVSEIPGAVNWLKNMCHTSGMELISCGTIIDENGNLSSWSYTRTSANGSSSPQKTDLAQLAQKYKDAKAKSSKKNSKDETSENTTELQKVFDFYDQSLFPDISLNFLNIQA